MIGGLQLRSPPFLFMKQKEMLFYLRYELKCTNLTENGGFTVFGRVSSEAFSCARFSFFFGGFSLAFADNSCSAHALRNRLFSDEPSRSDL